MADQDAAKAAAPMEKWDDEKIYDEQIAPLMTQILVICQKHRMPMVASFMYGHDGETRLMCTSLLTYGGRIPDNYMAAWKEIDRKPFIAAFAILKGPT